MSNASMMMVGRILFGLPFIAFGIIHFMYADMLKGAVPSYVPGGVIWVYFTGVLFIASSLSILANRMVKEASLTIAGLMLLFIVTIHLPGMMDPARMRMTLSNLLKDTIIMGGAVLLGSMTGRRE